VTTKRTVLVVDDDASLRISLAANLEEEGYLVVEAEDGVEAVAAVEKRPEIDVIVSDVRMPRMDGVSAFRSIKRLRPDLPVILVTAFANEGLLRDAVIEGVFTIIRKPFDTRGLFASLARALAKPSVLVVDDDADHGLSLSAGMQGCGCRVLAATALDGALGHLANHVVDVAIVDLVMPIDGVQVAEALRAKKPDIDILVMTGHDVPELIRKSSKVGARSALRKPLDVREVVRIVGELRGRNT
jgi:DNA-binding NtrC family response regulator